MNLATLFRIVWRVFFVFLAVFITLIGVWVFSAEQASAYIDLPSYIAFDTIWQSEEIYVISGFTEINPGVTVTVEPGAIIKFNYGAYLIVRGTLMANGIQGGGIYFTSIADDTVGGDTNGDGTATSPNYGDLGAIKIIGEADLNYVVIRYGGRWPQYAGIFQVDGSLKVTNSIIESNIQGLEIAGGETIIENNIFRNNYTGLEVGGAGNLSFNNNSFINNYSSVATIVMGAGRYFESSGNTVTGGGQKGIVIYGAIDTDQIWTDQIPYIITGSNLYINSGKTLTINPGAKIKFEGVQSYLIIYGNLNINGTNNNKVYFTSIADDTVGGDTNGDGVPDGSIPHAGQIVINPGAVVNFNHAVVRYGGPAWSRYSSVFMAGGVLNMAYSKIESAFYYGLKIFGGYADIINSEITNNAHGLYIDTAGLVNIANSSIAGNSQYGLYNGTFFEVNAENNWWGDSTGPYNLFNNIGGAGDKVSTFVDFEPWLTLPPDFGDSPEEPTLKEPVIIIPGILGSRLNRVSDGEEVWPNIFKLSDPLSNDEHLLDLNMDSNGDEIIDIYPASILDREALVFPFYENLVEAFENEGYIRDQDLIIFPYDWRLDNVYTSSLLKDVIDFQSALSPTGKVNIVAHSMGSLVTKEYLRQNQADLSKINNIVFAGSPQLGAPKAFVLLNYGDNLGIPILNKETAKDIAQNMPSVYQLLPSEEYINLSGGYVIDRRSGTNNALSFNETEDFMLDDLSLADYRNELLLNNADQFHQNLDHLDINGPSITNLVGCSVDTLSGLEIKNNNKYKPDVAKGDGTVPLISAKNIFSSNSQTNYYAVRGLDHFDLVSDDQALALIKSVAMDQPIPDLSDISSTDSDCYFNARRLFIFGTHSPVDIRVYDDEGNYTGLDDNGDVHLGIQESDLIQIGDNNFVLVPEGDDYRAVISAYDTGSFDFDLRILAEDYSTEDVISYNNIIITDQNLIAEFLYNGDLDNLFMSIDKEGDGNFEVSLSPSFVIVRSEEITTANIINNTVGLYKLGWIEDKIREYIIKKLELVDKLEIKSDLKDGEIRDILNEILDKMTTEFDKGLIHQEAYDIIREDIRFLINS